MPFEIERKSLVVGDTWRSDDEGHRYCQGYLARTDGITVRVRRAGRHAYVTIKGEPDGIVRPEFDYEIPVEDAEHMFKALCARPLIEKIRYESDHEGLIWSVDEFGGENAGLVVAEIELAHPDQKPALPD